MQPAALLDLASPKRLRTGERTFLNIPNKELPLSHVFGDEGFELVDRSLVHWEKFLTVEVRDDIT